MVHMQSTDHILPVELPKSYRLRRRIERATPVAVPLQSQQKVGYQFRAPLIAA